MARDMDFSVRQKRAVPTPPPQPTPPVLATSSGPIKSAPSSSRSSLLTWSIVILLVLVGLFSAWQYFKAVGVSQKPTSTTAATSLSTPNPTTNNLIATKNSLPSVQVYDSGAGADAVSRVIGNLKALGFNAEDENKSQFNYDKTYVWYITGLEDQAKKVQSTLVGRDVELKESKSVGSFEIMVLLGSK